MTHRPARPHMWGALHYGVLLLFLSGLWLSFAGGCEVPVISPPHEPVSTGTSCINSSDCPSPLESCIDRKCVNKSCECTQDEDCLVGKRCSQCKCVDRLPTQTCQTQTDCQRDSPFCVSGECLACRNDADCSSGNTCNKGICITGNDRPCQSSRDCPRDASWCNPQTMRCVECFQDNQCSLGETCQSNRCNNTNGCTCQDTKDCPGGQFCEQCKCTAIPQPGAPCSPQQPCPNPLVCVTTPIDGKSHCFQSCAVTRPIHDKQPTCSFNKDGRNVCVQSFPDSTLSLCLKERKEGESCGKPGTEQAICRRSQSPVLYCDPASKTCKRPTLRTQKDDTCDGVATQCDRSKGLVCDQKEQKCVPTTVIAAEGQVCRTTGGVICEDALSCVRLSIFASGAERCAKLCAPQDPKSCSHNNKLTCFPILPDGRGACLQTNCSASESCVFPEFVCTTFADANICLPF